VDGSINTAAAAASVVIGSQIGEEGTEVVAADVTIAHDLVQFTVAVPHPLGELLLDCTDRGNPRQEDAREVSVKDHFVFRHAP